MRTLLIAIVLAAVSTATPAQWYPDSDCRSPDYWRYLQQQREEFDQRQRDEEARNKKRAEEMYGEKPSSSSPQQQQGPAGGAGSTDLRALGQKLLRTPPLPDERNLLLGRWRLEVTGKARPKNDNERLKEMLFNTESYMQGSLCEVSFGSGIEFKPTTFNSDGVVGIADGSVAYRNGANKNVIVAIPADKRANPMFFDVSNPNRIVNANAGDCALVRVGAPAASAAANAATAPGNARTGAANASVPPAAGAMPQIAAASVVVEGAAFRCGDGSLLFVSVCQGNTDDATCKLTELHLPGLQMGKSARRGDIAARVKGCEAGGIRYGADDKPVFVR